MRKLIAFGFLAAAIAAIVTVAAAANPRGSNGRIVFARFDPALGDDFIYTANPDGSHEQQALATGAEGPRWSPDGSRVVVDRTTSTTSRRESSTPTTGATGTCRTRTRTCSSYLATVPGRPTAGG